MTTKIRHSSKEELIKHLQELAESHGNITRNRFRQLSTNSDSSWEEHFGTFGEYRRQAGLSPARMVVRELNNIARHVSLDSLRSLTEGKRGYEGKYQNPDNGRYATIIIGSDVHDIECDPFWREVFIDTIKRVQPNRVELIGDVFDLPEFGKYNVDPRTWDVVGRIRWVHEFLKDIRTAAQNSTITMLEGNHEYRLLRHLSEATPALKAILADLHGWSVPELLGLDKFEVNYVAPADLATFNISDVRKELKRNWYTVYDTVLMHHFPEGRSFGLPGCNGHHHSHISSSEFSPVYGTYEWHQLGCGHLRAASYCNGEKWSNGFMICHIDRLTKHVQFEYIDTTHDHCVVGGKWYTRKEENLNG